MNFQEAKELIIKKKAEIEKFKENKERLLSRDNMKLCDYYEQLAFLRRRACSFFFNGEKIKEVEIKGGGRTIFACFDDSLEYLIGYNRGCKVLLNYLPEEITLINEEVNIIPPDLTNTLAFTIQEMNKL